MKVNKEEKEYIRNIIQLLSEKMPDGAIQRTRKADTKKKYDTDGYSYQYCVDRFNGVCQAEWGFEWEEIHTQGGNYKSGAPFVDITVKLGIWVVDKDNVRSNVGGHRASLYADALKGAITNAFKKTAAFWGVGRDAYAGTIDDDNNPLPDWDANIETKGEKEKKISREEIIKKMSYLPPEIQDYFKIMQMTDAEKYEFCKKYEWDLLNMKKAVNAEGCEKFEDIPKFEL